MNKKILYLGNAGVILFSSIILAFVTPNQASAAANYNLISESVYLNKKAMTQAQIQSFLESKKSALATYKDQGPNETKQELASYLIWHAAQIWGINPQVILATLQKEQSLITKQSPTSIDYRSAMGYGCPDGADCNAKYYGFANQVNMASYQFRYNYEVLGGKTSFTDGDGDPHGVGSYACMWSAGKTFYNNHLTPGSTVTFKRNTAISGTKDRTVTIANKSTASLLCYTPHVGPYATTGYSGSDNFVYWFTQWFGNPVDEYNYKFENLVGTSGLISNNVSANAAAQTIVVGDKIYTFYFDSNSKSLRLAHYNGKNWSDRVIDGRTASTPGTWGVDINTTSMSGFAYRGEVQLYFNDTVSKTIRHVYEKSGQLRVETLDGIPGSVVNRTRNVGSAITSLVDTTGGIQLYYYNNDNKAIEHSWWDTHKKVWKTETLDGVAGSVIGRSDNVGSSLSSLLYKDNIQLFYHNNSTGELVHTWWDVKQKMWKTERMDGDTDTVLGNYINAGKKIDTTVFKDRLFIVYYDDASIFAGNQPSAWRIAYWSGSSWIQNALEGGIDGLANPATSVPLTGISMVNYNDKSVQIFYGAADNQLRHAWVSK